MRDGDREIAWLPLTIIARRSYSLRRAAGAGWAWAPRRSPPRPRAFRATARDDVPAIPGRGGATLPQPGHAGSPAPTRIGRQTAAAGSVPPARSSPRLVNINRRFGIERRHSRHDEIRGNAALADLTPLDPAFALFSPTQRRSFVMMEPECAAGRDDPLQQFDRFGCSRESIASTAPTVAS